MSGNDTGLGSEAGATATRRKLTLQMINDLDDAFDAMELMEQEELDMDGLEGLGDAKQRLRLHLQRDNGKSTRTPDQLLISLKTEDETRRSKLMQLYSEIEEFMDSYYDKISRDPEILKQFNDLRKQFFNHKALLERNDCPILVSGEISAGKSSLLNLLLQRKLLPESHLCCTAVICKLRYGEQVKAIVTRHDGKQLKVDLKSDLTAFDDLKPYIHQPPEDRHQDFPYKEVEIFVPYDILKAGIFIVDSPGIGESASMEQRLTDYMNEEEIFAFIYVVKSDNAGGVSKDRLQRILATLANRQDSKQSLPFDPRCAIFVCNRWDIVEKDAATVGPEELGKVKEKIENTLAKSWSGLDPSQIFYMSTTKAWNTHEATGYVTDDFAELLDGLQRLVPIGLMRKIQMSHRHLNDYCGKVLHIAESFLHKATVGSPALLKTQMKASKQLTRIAEDHQATVRRLRELLEDRAKEVRKDLIAFLNSKTVKKAIAEWEKDELPILESGDTWYEFEAKTLAAVQDKLAVVIFRWERENGTLTTMEGALLLVFEESLEGLESQLRDAQLVLEGQEPTRQDSIMAEENLSVDDLLVFSKDFNSLLLANASPRQRITAGITSQLMLPFLFIRDLFLGTSKTTVEQQQKKTMDAFSKKQEKFMQDTMVQVIKNIQSSESINVFVHNRLQAASKKIDEIEAAIPTAIQDENTLMESLKRDDRSKTIIHKWLWPVVVFLKNKMDLLADFGNTYTHTADFDEKDISRDKNGTTWQGMWSQYSIGSLKESRKTQICIKTTTQNGGSIADELEILRKNSVYLQHSKIGHYGGLLGAFGNIPEIVFIGPTSSLRLLFKSSNGHGSPGGNVQQRLMAIKRQEKKDYLEQLVNALHFVHYKGWVHMELSLDTVLVGGKKIYLSNLGKPRSAPITPKLPAGSFVYLPPEVILGDVYRSAADVYSLGMLCWELWYGCLALSDQRDRPLAEFANGITDEFLQGNLVRNSSDCPFAGIIKSCLRYNPEHRPKVTSLIKEVKHIVV